MFRALPGVDVTVPGPDTGLIDRLMEQPWFYPAAAAAIIALVILMVWAKIPVQLRWLVVGGLIVFFFYNYVQ
jgi:hypothetical protein